MRPHERHEGSMPIIGYEAMDFINQTYRRHSRFNKIAPKNHNLDFQQLTSNLEKKNRGKLLVINGAQKMPIKAGANLRSLQNVLS